MVPFYVCGVPIFVIGAYKCNIIEIGAWGTYFVWVRIIPISHLENLVIPSVTGLDPQNIRNELINRQKIVAKANYNEPIHNMHCMSMLGYFKAPSHGVVPSLHIPRGSEIYMTHKNNFM